jgi:subtilisin family serine protease
METSKKEYGMKSTVFLLSLCLMVISFSGLESGEFSYHDKLFEKTYNLNPIEDQVMIKFEAATNTVQIEESLRALDLEDIWKANIRDKFGVYQVPSSVDRETVMRKIRKLEIVRSADHPVLDQEGFTKYYIPDELTVRFNRGVPEDVQLDLIKEMGCEVSVKQRTPGYYTLRFPDKEDLFRLVRAFMKLDEVMFSEPSYYGFNDLLFIPNDTNFSTQWALKNTGQYGGIPGCDIEATLAWDLEMGDPDVILVDVDTGIDLDHPDLAANILPRGGDDWDFEDPDGSPDDFSGHGTCTAGIAAAVTNNNRGVAGVAPNVMIMPLRVDLMSGMNQNRADAINYAVSRRPEFAGMVISCSWRMSSGDFTAVHEACQNAYNNDVVVCFATGNYNSTIDYPAKYPETIAVGASSQCDERKSYTSCDGETWWGSNYGSEMDVVAPGVDIYTTDIGGGGGYSSGDYFDGFNGTSAACPHAAGVAALILSVNPTLSNHQVRSLLGSTAEDEVGPPGEDTPGWDQHMGWGRVNARQAVEAAQMPLSLSVEVTPVDTVVALETDLEFSVVIENLLTTDAYFDAWIDVILWNGSPHPNNPIVGPRDLLLSGEASVSRSLSAYVPAKAPVNNGYQLIVRTGFHPDNVVAEDGFYFDIVE